MTAPDTYEVKRLGDMQRAYGGALARVRAELGITAFGVQVADLPPSSGGLAPEHDHRHDGQEELYLLLTGSAEVVVPDGIIALDKPTKDTSVEELTEIVVDEYRRARAAAQADEAGGRSSIAVAEPDAS